MTNLDLSIIVPAYNVEKYIEECIESVLKQEFKNYELIIVEDFSKDGTKEKIKKYEKEKNIKIIYNLENKGQAFSRNLGLKISKGRYVLFLDADDYLNKINFKEIIHYLDDENLEIITFNFYNLRKKETIRIKRKLEEKKIITGKDFLKLTFSTKESYPMPWLYLYSREFLIKNKLYFNTSMRGEEDSDLYIKIMFCAERIGYKNIEIVFYRENFEGQSKNKRDRSKNYQTIVETYQNKLKEINNDDELEQVLFNYIGYFTKNIIKDKIRWKDYRYIIKNRDELAQLLLKNNNYKYKILGNILKLL